MKNKYTHKLTIMVILAISIGCSTTAVAQDKKQITGTVSDDTGPLLGASILIKNTSQGATTDEDGRFALMAKSSDTLVFSYLGLLSQEIPVNLQTRIDVILESDETSLDEVVINAGYYKVSEREKTGSISRMNAQQIERQPVSNPLAAMQGSMSGVNIAQQSGVPGAGFDVEIRGKNSLRPNGNSPLFIIDGVPLPAENLGDPLASAGILPGNGLSPLNIINPVDIESIEVLKDADATAIYGSRGANGVILITTKKGKTGKTKFKINTYTGAGAITRRIKLMNTEQYIKMREQAHINDGLTELPFYSYDINGTWSKDRYTDWQKELIGGTAYANSIQTTISGGSTNTGFLISGTHYNETTVFPGNFNYKKSTIHFNINHNPSEEKWEILFLGSMSGDKNNLLATDLTREAYSLAPNAPTPYNEDGTLNWENSTWNNPFSLLEQKYLAENQSLIANGTIAYKPFNDVKISVSMGITNLHLEESKTSPSTIYDPAYGFGSDMAYLILNNAKVKSWNIEPKLTYNRNLLGGIVKTLIGATFESREKNQSGTFASGFSNNSLINNPAAASEIYILNAGLTQYRYNALFGRINYSYNEKYHINITGRRDGSSRFGPGKRFANFGALGASWIFSDERLFENSSSWLSFGKIRGSYGITGSDQIGDYQYLNTYNLSDSKYGGIPGLEPSRLFNPDFSWETSKKAEAALELGLVENKLFLTLAYYQNRSSNQLVGIPLPGTTGFNSVTANLNATVQNTGWELDIQNKLVNRNFFSWTTSLNLSVPKNKLVSFPDLEGSTYANQYVIGQPLNIQKVYHYIGLDRETGIYQFEDYNGDGQITSANDREKVIVTDPKFFGGVQNNISYKNWRLDFLLQFVKQIGRNQNDLGVLPGTLGNLPVTLINAWEQPGDNSTIQPYTTGINSEVVNSYYNYSMSDAVFSDASFIRLKNLSISYLISIKSYNCKIYMQGQNLLTLTRFKGADPEIQSGIQLPSLRVISFGTEINF
jgi:TonB-linked SusC/RagA family outer membrane protein